MEQARRTATEYAHRLAEVFGDRLRSVILHGSLARGEAVPGVSDINLAVFLDAVDAGALRLAASATRRFVQAGNTVPLFMGWGEWRRAADSFAIELADMRDAHSLLHGEDPLADMHIDRIALRLQAERELRGKLIQLRGGLLLTGDDPREVGRLLVTALPSFATYLRTALRLAGHVVPPNTDAVIEEGARLVGAAPDPMLAVWSARSRHTPFRVEVDDPLAVGYYDLAERTAHYVDTFVEGGGA